VVRVRRPIVNKGHEQGQVKVHQLGLDEVQHGAVAAGALTVPFHQ